ncbi:MAG: cupin domain-containing protein [Lachnospiraceae bacterium]
MNDYRNHVQTDHGPAPFVANIKCMAVQNRNFRTAIWTGRHLQMTIMCIPPYEDIGVEVHEETDQFVRIEQGNAIVKMGNCKCEFDFCQTMFEGDGVFIPAGTWHNIVNIGMVPLKVSSIYAPPNHPRGTIHPTKADAKAEEN